MDDLTTLLREAVDDVEPTDRLADIRRRTSRRPGRRAVHRWYAAAGAALATAAVVTGIAVVLQPAERPARGPAADATSTAGAGPGTVVPVYYVGDTPAGARLYRELRSVPETASVASPSLLVAIPPDDPDYRTAWPEGALGALTVRGDVAEVPLLRPDLRDRPAGTSAAEAAVAVQQVVYTVTANLPGAGRGAVAVQFTLDGNPVDQVLGVPTSEPLARASQTEVLAAVSIGSPAEGQVVSGSFRAEGLASTFEGTVLWELRDESGAVVASGYATAPGPVGRLAPWTTGEIGVAGLEPGDYAFVASESDPSGGTEGFGPTSDTRTVSVR